MKHDKNLPTDISQCHEIIGELLEQAKQQQLLIEKLEYHVELLVRSKYGQKADRVDPNQALLFELDELKKDHEEKEQESGAEEDKKPAGKKKGHGRRRLPKHIPRERIEYDVPEDERICQKCGTECEHIGEETHEQLEYIPAKVKVLVHVRAKYACKSCEDTVITALKPPQPVEKGLAGPGLLAHIATCKYGDHLPLHRMEGILRRHDIEISRSTMCDWMRQCADLTKPLHKLMKKRILSSTVVHTDDTPIPVQDRNLPKTRKGRIWVYIGDRRNPYTLFDYTPNRKRDGPVNFLSGYKGYLQADAFGGYDGIYASGDVKEVACWAHARRKFVDAQSTNSKCAVQAVAWIKRLYRVEQEGKELTPEALQARRQSVSAKILEEFKRWLKEQKVLPKSPMGQAISYTLSNWKALNQYLEDGELDMDNNEAERALRTVVVGRKNYMFVGSDRGGTTASILYSLISTCKTCDIDPWLYLMDVFSRIPAHPLSRLEELLPDKWFQAKVDEQVQLLQSGIDKSEPEPVAATH